MALQLSGDIAGLGKIVQIVRATDSTNRSTTDTSFVDVPGMSVSITPSKSDSFVIVISNFRSRNVSTSSGSTYGEYRILDSSNSPVSGTERVRSGAVGFTVGTGNFYTQVNMIGFSYPATTSSVTYRLQFTAAGGTNELQNQVSPGQMIAIEVAA